MKKVIAMLLMVSLLAGCSGWSRQSQGTAGGAVIGGVAGAALTHGSIAGTAVGAVGGALVGHAVTQ
jgi:osmotically inducible lipoprotein OsmB